MIAASVWQVPEPVLFNPWKHHAGALRQRIAEAIQGGEPALVELANQLVVIGTELMDLYTGKLAPAEVAAMILANLQAEQRLQPEAYRDWIQANHGYQVVTLDADQSRWVLRLGDEAGRHVHIHPGRWAPQTRRVRANVLKTAILVLAHVGVHGGEPLNVAQVNAIRRRYLQLAPMKELAGDQGLGAVIDVLRAAGA